MRQNEVKYKVIPCLVRVNENASRGLLYKGLIVDVDQIHLSQARTGRKN